MHKILISLLILLCSCGQKKIEPVIYPFKGIVIDVFKEQRKMMIKHDEVPGFMMEMTMMFNIDPSIDLDHYAIGDSLNFNFYILEEKNASSKTWADQIKLVGHRELTEEEVFDDFFEEDEVIQIGEKISDFKFLNLEENEVELNAFDGKLKFISFIFSRCPMPNFCPSVILKNQYLINQFRDNANIEFIIISFDYNYDTPKVLKKAYGSIFENYSNIHFLSSYGYKENILKFTMEAGLGFSGIDEGDARDINHTLKSLLVSPEGILIESFGGDSWLPKEVELNIKSRLKAYGLD
jgi:protein SCO1/2